VRLGRIRPILLVAALWLGAGVTPERALAQERAPVSAVASLALQPWHGVDWTRSREAATVPGTEKLADEWSLREPVLEGITWKSAFEEREVGTHDSLPLVSWEARSASPLWAGTVIGDFHLIAVEPANALGTGIEPRRWLRLAIKENWGRLALGVRFESVSPGLEKVTGGDVKGETEGGEVWLEGREGPVSLRLSGGQFWDNLADYPWAPRTTKTQGGTALGLSLPIGTALSVGYQSGLAERAPGVRPRTALAAAPQASEFQSVLTSLTCGGAAWGLTVSSTYDPSNDLRNPAQETTSLTHDVSASLQLLPSITIMPAVSVTEDAYEWSGIRSQTTSASVSVSWISILEGVDLTVWGSYARNKTTDNLYDATAINTAADLVWRLRQVGSTRASLALEVGSNHYLDGVTAPAETAEVYGMLTLRIATF
jgi:hypothetical protein